MISSTKPLPAPNAAGVRHGAEERGVREEPRRIAAATIAPRELRDPVGDRERAA